MPDLPVMLNVNGKRCVIVGGGATALRRAQSLLEAGAAVTVIAPDIDPQLAKLNVTCHQRPYQRDDLNGAVLVVIATNNTTVNEQVAQDARAAGILINQTDQPQQSDITIPAHVHRGPLTIAVHTDGISPVAAAVIRDQLADALDPAWIQLLQIAQPWRDQIRREIVDPDDRRRRLMQLTDQKAMETLKKQGPDALKRYCRQIARAPDRS